MVPGVWSLEVVIELFVIVAFEHFRFGSSKKWQGVIWRMRDPSRRAIARVYEGERTAAMWEAVGCGVSVFVCGVGSVGM